MSQVEDYSHDFEEVSASGSASGGDTSQFIQSEDFEADEVVDECISDEETDKKVIVKGTGVSRLRQENDRTQTGDDGKSEAASSSKSAGTLEELQKFFETAGDEGENAPTPDMAEIENIMRKLDKLEKAQSMLETTLNLDWVDNNPEFAESTQHLHSKTSVKPAGNISDALSAELNSVEKLIKMESKSLEVYKSQRSGQNSTAASIASVGVGDRSLEDVLKEYNELEQSVSADIDDVVKPIPTDPLSTHSSLKTSSGQRKTGDGNSSANNSPNLKNSQVNFKAERKSRPKSAGKNQFRSQNFTDKFNELVNSELLKESDSLAASSQYVATKSQSYDANKGDIEPEKYNPRSVYGTTGTVTRKKLSASRNRRPASAENSESNRVRFPPSKMGAGEGILLLDEIIASSPEIGAGSNAYVIEKLKTEMSRQETLIDAYQTDSQKLYTQLKNSQEEWTKEKDRYEGEINSLKTEVATLKVNRLAQSSSNSSPLFGAGNKAELDRLKDESASKSELITDLRREILLLRNSQAARPTSSKKSKAAALSEEKENEYQKTIRGLNKQVRTLQKILYSKDPAAAAAILSHESKEGKGETQTESHTGPFERKNSQVPVLESRVTQLEKELAKADSEAKDKLKEFQQKLQGIKNKYEDRIKELEQKLEEANVKIYEQVSNSTTLELSTRLEKGQLEINHLKSEIIKYKRELEIAAKSTANSSAPPTKQDSATLSLAIKSFKSELADKEKEILKLRKEIADLKRTNNNLKREREKYLVQTNAQSTSGSNVNAAKPKVLTRAKTDLGLKPGRISAIKGALKKPNSAPKVTSDTVQILQNALDREREEFEKLIEEKTRQITEQEKQIVELQSKIKTRRVEFLTDENRETLSVDLDVMDDLRERVLTQNKVIIALKEHIASFKSMEEEFANWKQDKERLEYRNKELARKCAAAEEFRKPENEILLSLSQKVDDLDSRYHYREKQLDSLLNRLSLRTGGSASLAAVLSPRLTMFNGSVGNHHSRKTDIDVDLHQLSLSPTTNFHLLAGTNLV